MEQPKPQKAKPPEALRTPFESEGGDSDKLDLILHTIAMLREDMQNRNKLG